MLGIDRVWIMTGAVPASWQQYQTQKGLSLLLWMTDFSKRLSQLVTLARVDFTGPIWLGGLFRPTGWITASRQQAARVQQVSLEVLQLSLELGGVWEGEMGAYLLEGQ